MKRRAVVCIWRNSCGSSHAPLLSVALTQALSRMSFWPPHACAGARLATNSSRGEADGKVFKREWCASSNSGSCRIIVPGWRDVQHFLQARRIERRGAFLVVVEIHEHVATLSL